MGRSPRVPSCLLTPVSCLLSTPGTIDVIIYGLNPVREALRAGRARELRVSGTSTRVVELERLAARARIPVRHVPAAALDRASSGGNHQGVAAEVDTPADLTLDELLSVADAPPLVLVLDGVEDPQNFGAILRVADAAGVDGVVRQTRRAASLGAVARSSAGALAHVRLALRHHETASGEC